MDAGLLIIRLVVGLTLAAHGAQKLFGVFGGRGIGATGTAFETLGFRPGKVFAAIAGLGETGGGLALALGLLTPMAAGVMAATMIGAAALGIAFTGPGKLSVDAALGLSFGGTRWGLLALAMSVFGAIPPLSTRARSPNELTKN